MEATKQIDAYIAKIRDWRGLRLAKLRKLIHSADPNIEEDWKWSTPVFAHDGVVCALGAFKDHIKLNFFQGAKLADPKKLFNAGLEAKTSRAMDIFEKDKVNEVALKALIRAAVKYNEK